MDATNEFANATMNMTPSDMTLFQKIVKKMLIPIVILVMINMIFAGIYYIFCNDPEDWNGMDDDKDTFMVKIFKRFYFSMTTMSTVGYGDISPKSIKARSLVIVHFIFVLFELLSNFI